MPARKHMKQRTSSWKNRFGLVPAFLFPGLPQLLRPQPRLQDGIVFLVGVGSLIGWIWFLFVLPVHNAPLENFYWLSVMDLAEIYPLHLTSAIQAAGDVQPILPDNAYLLVRFPFFWESFACYCGLYAICAGISVWDYRKVGQVAS